MQTIDLINKHPYLHFSIVINFNFNFNPIKSSWTADCIVDPKYFSFAFEQNDIPLNGMSNSLQIRLTVADMAARLFKWLRVVHVKMWIKLNRICFLNDCISQLGNIPARDPTIQSRQNVHAEKFAWRVRRPVVSARSYCREFCSLRRDINTLLSSSLNPSMGSLWTRLIHSTPIRSYPIEYNLIKPFEATWSAVRFFIQDRRGME